jgi:DegV family protein with EDD domain
MIKILIDSASDIDLQEATERGIYLVPMKITFGDEEYLDGINLSHRQFFEKLIESSELPRTSQINEFDFDEKFAELTKDGSEVIAITISSKLSGTYAQAKRAAANYAGKVFVVDSLNASIGERVLCDLALRLVGEGLRAQAICKKLDEKKKKIQVLALLDTLKYLKKGGRISSVQAIAGEVFSIKPVITITGGEVKMAGKAVGSKKGNNLLNTLVSKCGGIDFDMPFNTAYSGLSDEFLQKYMKDSSALWESKTDSVPAFMIGSTIGTHIGPNAIAVSFFAKD